MAASIEIAVNLFLNKTILFGLGRGDGVAAPEHDPGLFDSYQPGQSLRSSTSGYDSKPGFRLGDKDLLPFGCKTRGATHGNLISSSKGQSIHGAYDGFSKVFDQIRHGLGFLRQALSASSGVFWLASIWMSAPETKALVPKPVNTAPLILEIFLNRGEDLSQLLEYFGIERVEDLGPPDLHNGDLALVLPEDLRDLPWLARSSLFLQELGNLKARILFGVGLNQLEGPFNPDLIHQFKGRRHDQTHLRAPSPDRRYW